mgnify:CR=1 FL=1
MTMTAVCIVVLLFVYSLITTIGYDNSSRSGANKRFTGSLLSCTLDLCRRHALTPRMTPSPNSINPDTNPTTRPAELSFVVVFGFE